MASSRSRHRRPVLQPLVEDASHRLLNYAIRRYVFKDAAGHHHFGAPSRDASVANRSLGEEKEKDKEKDKGTTSRSMPGLSRAHTTGAGHGGEYRDGGGGHDAAFEHIERFGRSIYDSISGRRQAKKAEREREERRAARHQQRREEERERRRQRRQRDHQDRDDRARNVERVERIVGDLHGVSGTLRDMGRRPPSHACDFYEGFAQREKRMQRALGGAIGGLREVVVVEGRGDRSARSGRSGRSEGGARSWDSGSRHAATTAGSSRAGERSSRHSKQQQQHTPAPSDAQSTNTNTNANARHSETGYAGTPSMRRRKRRTGSGAGVGVGGVGVGAGLNQGYYGPGNPTYESDPGWRTGEQTRERMHREHGSKKDDDRNGEKGGRDAGERQGSWERRRPRRG